jgi:hypothetical protein
MRSVWCTVVAACVALACVRPPRPDRNLPAAAELYGAVACARAPGRIHAPRPWPIGPYATASAPRVIPPEPRLAPDVVAAAGVGFAAWSGAASSARGPPPA